jgi:[acyl-carrier-protein] S-malonyltransferase
MGLAVIFPGQGSQFVGMGKALAEQYDAAQAVFDEVDDALGQRLSDIIFNGPEDQLTLTANAQPALMAVSIAVIRVLKSHGFKLDDKALMVAGHSLGEYSALCAVGALSLSDTARLLRIRGEAMQAAVPVGAGAMAAIIGLEHDIVEAICAEAAASGVCQIANDNGGGQLVVSGSRQAVEDAAAIAKKKGARRALLLPVSAPFHSRLMAPAAEVMAQALSKVIIRKPALPIVCNVRARPVDEPDEILSALVEQVTGQVRWRESVVWMAQNGIEGVLEAGAGKVLCGLVKRIARDMNTMNAGTPEEVESALGSLA